MAKQKQTREIVHDTYNIIKYPVMDTGAQTLLFNFVTYHFPDEDTKLQKFYNRIVEEIDREKKDFGALVRVLDELKPYKTQMKVNPQRRQTAIYDPIEGRRLN